MRTNAIFSQHQFVYRLALASDANGQPPPTEVIEEFFELGNITEIKRLFTAACGAALSEQYNWNSGSPGNLLYIYERIETLIEACFILYTEKRKRKNLSRRLRRSTAPEFANDILLPSSLTAEEIKNPVLVIQSFFKVGTLKEWKLALYAWLEAGLSEYDVLQNVEITSILPYHVHLQRLLDACWYINRAIKNNSSKR